ncbi:uncharacterized protein LOC144781052 [Lissotriton helveticus]
MAAYHCCVPFCTSDSRYNVGKNISFHRIPAVHVEPKRHQEWLNRIRRDPGPYFKISTCTRVCSKHFLPSDFMRTLTGKRNLKPECVPSVFQWSEDAPSQIQPTKKKNLGTNKNILKSVQPVLQTQPGQTETMETVSFLDHCYDIPPMSDSEMLVAAREEIARLQQRTALLEGKLFFLERFSNDSNMIYFYTGFMDYVTLKAFFVSLRPSSANAVVWKQCQHDAETIVKDGGSSEETLSLIDQFFLFLCKVRQGFPEEDLAIRFNVSQSTVTKMIITWANYLYILFRDFVSWPSRESIDKHMPAIFQATYPRARVILSCIELKVQASSFPNPLAKSVSVQNKYTAFKGLLGISPHGEIIFKSPLYSGSTSENEITKLSGILELLEPNDIVIAATQFAIQEDLQGVNAHFVEYPFPCHVSPSSQGMDEEIVAVEDVEIEEVLAGEGHISAEEPVASVEEAQLLVEGADSVGELVPDAVVEKVPVNAVEEIPEQMTPETLEKEVSETVAEEMSSTAQEEGQDTNGDLMPSIVGQELSVTFPEGLPVAMETRVASESSELTSYAEEELIAQESEETTYTFLEANQMISLTIHLEEVLSRIKEYRLLDTVIPLTLESIIHQLWVVCAGLAKLSDSQG